jgi:general secretion pathway protein M
MNAIKTWYGSLQKREQQFVSIGAALAGLGLLFGLVLLPLSNAANKSSEELKSKREDLLWIKTHVDEVRAASASGPTMTGEPAVVVVDRTARSAGLASALRGTQPDGNQSVRVQLEGAAFDVLIAWLADLDQHYGLAVDSITIDRGTRPGVVNASVSFTQPHS